jgi:hypothetical protein
MSIDSLSRILGEEMGSSLYQLHWLLSVQSASPSGIVLVICNLEGADERIEVTDGSRHTITHHGPSVASDTVGGLDRKKELKMKKMRRLVEVN